MVPAFLFMGVSLAWSLLLIPAVIIWLAALFFLQGTDVESGQAVLCGVAALSVPAAAWLAGKIMDKYAFSGLSLEFFAPATAMLAAMIVLRDGSVFELLAAVAVPHRVEGLLLLSHVLRMLSVVIYAASVSAFALACIPLAFELPLQWFLDGRPVSVRSEISAIRPLLILAGLGVGFHMFVDLFGRLLGLHLFA